MVKLFDVIQFSALQVMLMRAYVVRLPDELAAYLDDAVARGDWADSNDLFVQAVITMRTAEVLGTAHELPPPQAPLSQAAMPTPKANAFDTPTFMAGLLRKVCQA
jgi:hypothetical protein